MSVASSEREVETIPRIDYKPGSSLLQVVSEECDVVQLSKADILQIFNALQVAQSYQDGSCWSELELSCTSSFSEERL